MTAKQELEMVVSISQQELHKLEYVFSILRRMKQENCHEFEASLGYIVRLSKNKNKKNKKRKEEGRRKVKSQ